MKTKDTIQEAFRQFAQAGKIEKLPPFVELAWEKTVSIAPLKDSTNCWLRLEECGDDHAALVVHAFENSARRGKPGSIGHFAILTIHTNALLEPSSWQQDKGHKYCQRVWATYGETSLRLDEKPVRTLLELLQCVAKLVEESEHESWHEADRFPEKSFEVVETLT